MPELPEVETIKRQLTPNVLGKTISEVKVLSPKNFVGNKKDVLNRKIVSVDRYGKVLVLGLSPKPYLPAEASAKAGSLIPSPFLNFHFKLSGQILFSTNVNKAIFKNIIPFTGGKTMPANTTRVIIKFSDGSGLFFNDLRKFGWIKISTQPLKPKGIDVLDKDFTVKYLTVIFLTSSF